MRRPKILFYCQHSLGMGHLVRSLGLAKGLADKFDVHLLNGGRLPNKIKIPKRIKIINLPPLGFDANSQLVSHDRRLTVESAKAARKKIILRAYAELNPEIILVELFPFGRKKFADELLPLLAHAKGKAKIVCSLRDILVGKRRDQKEFETRAIKTANSFFDAILIHSDERFAKIEESLITDEVLRVPCFYTGFIAPKGHVVKPAVGTKTTKFVVSAGGGIVGEKLLRTAAAAHLILSKNKRIKTTLLGGLFLPENTWIKLKEETHGIRGLRLKRHVRDLCAVMSLCDVSVSQCGYNTALDILRSGVASVVVPFADGGEDEQTNRAHRLEKLGALKVLEDKKLNANTLAAEIEKLFHFSPAKTLLDLNGAENSAHLLEDLIRPKAPKKVAKNYWLAPVRSALERRKRPIKLFFRDDDAGWNDARLFGLLDVFSAHEMPLDVAVIPVEASRQLAAKLCRYIESNPTLFAVHQHGFSHVNHEPNGRKCEFGDSRSYKNIFSDITTGQQILNKLFGQSNEKIFTPPWNRCSQVTANALGEAGFYALSRESEAVHLSASGLNEVNITLDWFAKRHRVRLTRDEIGQRLAQQIEERDVIGIMLHHALMDDREMHLLDEFLGLFGEFGVVELCQMRNLVSKPIRAALAI